MNTTIRYQGLISDCLETPTIFIDWELAYLRLMDEHLSWCPKAPLRGRQRRLIESLAERVRQ